MLIIGRCKTINNIDPPILNSLFFFVKMYLISETFRFSHIIKKTVTYSLKTVSYRSSFMLADIPNDYKYQNSSQGKGKEWNAEICACRPCRH